ncbi:NB-ARC domain-containing protein [Yinghuangia seranimata]|uniref:NB-ARC domain-containing protein n=1 Tax=Yinghuangia seranimata TaxID=408067 RepID=UPI00248C87A2|nr:NB-ARC domain-containing protein [Yinghuangia seranimata]MDI2129235.1 NB-ARC domain-containing protein [Yinghuangia seranimata]
MTVIAGAVGAAANGAAGEAGKGAWATLVGLVGRLRGGRGASSAGAGAQGVAEALSERAGRDAGFADEVRGWLAEVDGIGGVAPEQLPPGAVGFVDRDGERAAMTAVLARSGVAGRAPVVLLSGFGGVGKSALGVEWARDVQERFPGGRLYADLGALAGPGGTVEVADVLAQFLRGLGVPDPEIPSGAAERAAMYRSVTAGSRVCVLLDDVSFAAQVDALLPASADSVVVATSHWRLEELAADGATVLPVGPLAVEHGVALLAGLIGRDRVDAEPERAAELVRLCGGLPIAVRTVAGVLAVRPGRSLAEQAGQLADEDGRLAALARDGRPVVQPVWDAAYRALPESAARTYRLLALHPGPDFTSDAVGALTGDPMASVRGALDALCRANLLEEGREGRYAFHDLVRLHALGLVGSDPEADAAARRAVAWYLGRAAAADHVAQGDRMRLAGVAPVGGFAGKEAALAWLAAERLNLVACVRISVERGWDDLAWRLCEPLWALFLHRAHYGDWIDTHRAGIDAAVREGDARAAVRVRCQLSRAYVELGRLDDARVLLAGAADEALGAGDRRLAASAWEFTGKVHLAAHAHAAAPAVAARELVQARREFERSLAVNEEIGSRRGAMLQRYHLAQVRAREGDPAGAVAAFDEARTTADALGDERMVGRIETGRGLALAALGRAAEAEAAFVAAADVMQRRHAYADEASALEPLVGLVLANGRVSDARGFLMRLADAYRRSGSPKATEALRRLAELP